MDDIPPEARLYRRGLDFGYTNDPAAIIDVYEYNGGYLLDEICYEKGMSNRKLADVIKAQDEQVLVVADSAEPKSIDEIKSYGVMIIGAEKGKNSVNPGISQMQDVPIYVTKRSTNLIKEYRNYLWLKDKKTGQFYNTPEGGLDHGLDAARYAVYKPAKGDANKWKPVLAKKKQTFV